MTREEQTTALAKAEQLVDEFYSIAEATLSLADRYVLARDIATALLAAKKRGLNVWPNIVAPAKYESPADGWEDPKLPDFTLIWKLAREMGYAVGLHGSMKRDVDMIAVPWTDEAVGNKALVDYLCQGLNATIVESERKPQGRYAFTLQIDGYCKPIDLSVMPRRAQEQP